MQWLRIEFSPTSVGTCAPDAEGDRLCVELPCPDRDLLELVALRFCAGPQATVNWWGRLRSNPSLLIWALNEYQTLNRQPAPSASELVVSCAGWGHARLARQTFELTSDGQQIEPGQEFWESYLRARKRGKLKRCLVAWLIRFAGLDRSQANRVFSKLLGADFRPAGLPCPGIRKRATLNQIRSRWQQDRPSGLDLLPMFELAIAHRQVTEHFESELQAAKLQAMKQLAYGASHEINNPLANIATRAQTMLKSEQHPEKQYKLSVIYQQAMRAHEMIADMMLFAHPPKVERKRVSLRLLMRKFLAQQQLRVESLGVQLRLVIGPGLDGVSVDPTQFLVALGCLVRNSLEAVESRFGSSGQAECWSPPSMRDPIKAGRGTVEIRIEAVAGRWRVAVVDNGLPIDDRVAAHLFDPFFSGREAGRGLGFGLSKVYRIVQQHGGSIRYDRDYPGGTRFEIELPLEEQIASSQQPALELELGATENGVADVA